MLVSLSLQFLRMRSLRSSLEIWWIMMIQYVSGAAEKKNVIAQKQLKVYEEASRRRFIEIYLRVSSCFGSISLATPIW